jgi:hypothetical protein
MKRKNPVVTYVTRQGSLLFDVILYIIAAAVVIASIYFGISALKTQADISSVTSNDMKVLMDTANSFKNGYYNSDGKYVDLSAKTSKAWSTLELDSDNDVYKSSKFDNACTYALIPHKNAKTDTNSGVEDTRYAIYIDCSAEKEGQNWSDEKTYQIELAYANSVKTRMSDAIIVADIDKPDATTIQAPDSPAPKVPSIDAPTGKLLIYNLFE